MKFEGKWQPFTVSCEAIKKQEPHKDTNYFTFRFFSDNFL